MSLFDAKILDADPDGTALLAAVLFPSSRDRAEACKRGRERLAQARSLAEAMAAGRATGSDRTASADPVA